MYSRINVELDSDLITGGNWFLDMKRNALVFLLSIGSGIGIADVELDLVNASEGQHQKLDSLVSNLSKGLVGGLNE